MSLPEIKGVKFMNFKKIISAICSISVILSATLLGGVVPSAEQQQNDAQSPSVGGVKVIDFMQATAVRTGGADLNVWQCGNDDAVINPFSGAWGLNAVWGHITVSSTGEGLVLENNGNDINPSVLRYPVGGDNLEGQKGIEIPVDSYLRIKAVANEKFNIVIPFYFGSVADDSGKTGFITLKNENGTVTAFNQEQTKAFKCNTVIEAGTLDVKIPLKSILESDGSNSYTAARVYSLDYVTPADVKAYKTVFKEIAIETDTLDFTTFTGAGINGGNDMYKWYKDDLENGSCLAHRGYTVNQITADSMQVEKNGNTLSFISNDGSDYLRLKFAGIHYGPNVSKLIVNTDNYLNFSIESECSFRIALHFIADRINDENADTWKMKTAYLSYSDGGLVLKSIGVDGDKNSYFGDEIPAGKYQGYGIDLSQILNANDANIKTAQIIALTVWTEDNTNGKVLNINEFSIGRKAQNLLGVSLGENPVSIDHDKNTVTINVSSKTDVTALEPDFILAEGTVSDKTGPKDFTEPVSYTFTRNGIEQTYTVTVIKASLADCELLSAKINDEITGVIDQENKTVVFNVPYGFDVTSVAPVFQISPDASISPTEPQNFTEPVVYTVTSSDASANNPYTVSIAVADAPAPIVSEAKIGDIKGFIDTTENTITFTLPYGSSVKALEPVFSFSTPDGTTQDKTGALDFTNPITYTFTSADGKSTSSYKVIVLVKDIPDGIVSSYTFDTNPEKWVKTGGHDEAVEVITYSGEYLEVKNTGGKWLNIGYQPLFANDIKLDINKAPYLYYDLSDTAEYWNVIISLKDEAGNVSEINLNRYLAYQTGKQNNWNIVEDGGYINYKSHRRYGSWTGKIKVADMISWAKSTGSVSLEGNMMDAPPENGIIIIDQITLHADSGQQLKNKALLVRTLAFDDEAGSHLPAYTASAGTHSLIFEPNSFDFTNPDSTAKIGSVTFKDSVLTVKKSGSGWMNFVGPLEKSVNVNAYDATLNLKINAEDVFRIYVTVSTSKGTSIQINLSKYIQSLSGADLEYLASGTYNVNYKILDLIKFQANINNVDYKDYISPNGVVSVNNFEFNMEGEGDRTLTVSNASVTTSGVDALSPVTGDSSSPLLVFALMISAAFSLIVISKSPLIRNNR